MASYLNQATSNAEAAQLGQSGSVTGNSSILEFVDTARLRDDRNQLFPRGHPVNYESSIVLSTDPEIAHHASSQMFIGYTATGPGALSGDDAQGSTVRTQPRGEGHGNLKAITTLTVGAPVGLRSPTSSNRSVAFTNIPK